jgi:UDP-N-acetylmuramoyl-L-alanyl-D-glutamate--2,6-diaminopimelate ligase
VPTFADLLAAMPFSCTVTGDDNTAISSPVEENSGLIERGGVFVARRGLSSDGHAYIRHAIERGAAAVVGEDDLTDLPVPYARVENAAEALGYLAAAYHDFPSRKLIVVGVTGTDGKTTTCTLIHSILQVASGGRAGLISTISAETGDASLDTGFHVTTPGAPQIQALLARMSANGLQYAVIEMTSHGLAQGRLNGIAVDVAVFTNITHEHLDYHGSFEAYRAAKARLLDLVFIPGHRGGKIITPFTNRGAVLNADDPNVEYLIERCEAKNLRYKCYGVQERYYTLREGDLKATDIQHGAQWLEFNTMPLGKGPSYAYIRTALAGSFNISNILAACTAAWKMQLNYAAVQQGVENVRAISGRMERIDEGQDYLALVDFAHTPNALKNALEAARQMTGENGRVFAVFGSAGLRDREKRKLMAETSIQLADCTILTAEDPRTESLDDILETMAQAAREAGGIEGETFIRVRDRGEAMYRACQMARTGDVVIACGKGHEQSMAFGTTEYAWDDRNALRAAIRGAPLKTLPTAGE